MNRFVRVPIVFLFLNNQHLYLYFQLLIKPTYFNVDMLVMIIIISPHLTHTHIYTFVETLLFYGKRVWPLYYHLICFPQFQRTLHSCLSLCLWYVIHMQIQPPFNVHYQFNFRFYRHHHHHNQHNFYNSPLIFIDHHSFIFGLCLFRCLLTLQL